jgi:hypothetical protein
MKKHQMRGATQAQQGMTLPITLMYSWSSHTLALHTLALFKHFQTLRWVQGTQSLWQGPFFEGRKKEGS